MKLKGKVALVTGGAQRVGRELAYALADRGCDVAITYLSSGAQAKQTVQALQAKKVRAVAVRVDQRDGRQVRQAVAQVLHKLGRIDVLINNASTFHPTPWDKVTDAQWDEALEANLKGPWAFSQAVGLHMKASKRAGKIVNIADVAVFSPWVDYLPYSIAKGGVVTLTRGLAKALAPHVQVNAVAPGPILPPPDLSQAAKRKALERTLVKRWGDPKDIVAAVLFFIEGSDFVTGTILPVDGGRLLA